MQPYYGNPQANPYDSTANLKDPNYINTGQTVQVGNPAYRYDAYGRGGYNYGPMKQDNSCMDECLACLAAMCCCCFMCDVLT